MSVNHSNTMLLFDEAAPPPEKGTSQKKRFDYDWENRIETSSEWIYDLVSANEWIVEVDDSYLNDNFNLYGLDTIVPDYQSLLGTIKGDYYDYCDKRKPKQEVESLYALIHSRYLLTIPGAKKILAKYKKQIYGVCPRVACNEQPLLPIGLSPNPGEMTVKTFCPCCQDVYDTEEKLDGAYFGPHFPHFFIHAEFEEIQIEPRTATPMTFLGVPVAPDSQLNRSALLHNGNKMTVYEAEEI